VLAAVSPAAILPAAAAGGFDSREEGIVSMPIP
jgi:hypothetical protein